MTDKRLVSFRCADEVSQKLEEVVLRLYRGRLKLQTGGRLKKQEVMAALIAQAWSLDPQTLETQSRWYSATSYRATPSLSLTSSETTRSPNG